MSDPRCAYCGAPGPLTREHLWPAALHRRRLVAAGDDRSLFWLRRTGNAIPSEVKIRDVCATCNNIQLSALDNYGVGLFDRTFIRIPERYENVLFEYDYHSLKRWLLKLCFNSARVHDARDLYVFQPLLPYILGRSNDLGKSVQLYVQMLYSAEVPISALKDLADAPIVFAPTDHRVGHLWFVAPGVGEKLLRAVHLRSYAFFMAFFKPGEAATVRQDFSVHFLDRFPQAALLRASRRSVALVCDGLSAWESLQASRENLLT